MYNKLDYVRRGVKFTNNIFFPGRKKISTLMIYSTSLCNSRCKHCLIWAKHPVETMGKEKIVEVMNSRCISKDTNVGLEGGEFLLHPEAMEILDWFSHNHTNFDLLTNCLKPDRVIDAVKHYPPRRLYVSLDGNKETYLHMRGRDAYDQVINVLKACKNTVPMSIMFTLSPYNNFSDMDYVIDIAKEHNVDIRIGIYNNMDFFDTVDDAHNETNTNFVDYQTADYHHSLKTANVAETSENLDFLLLYDEWRKGKLKLKCFSIYDSIVIHPNGDIPLCQNLDVKLGNLYENSLDEIFNSCISRKLQKEYANTCNRCWINFHRKYDIVLLRTLERFFPKMLIEQFYGKYQWSDNRKISYKKYLKKCECRHFH